MIKQKVLDDFCRVFLLMSLSGLAIAKVALICQILWRTYKILKLVGVITL